MIDTGYWIGVPGAEERDSFPRLVEYLDDFEREEIRSDYREAMFSDIEYLEEEDTMEIWVSENSELVFRSASAVEQLEEESAMFHGYNAGLGVEEAYQEIHEKLEPASTSVNGTETSSPVEEALEELSSFFNRDEDTYHGFYLGLKAAAEKMD